MTRYQKRRCIIEKRRFILSAIVHGIIIAVMTIVSIALVTNMAEDESVNESDYHLSANNASIELESQTLTESMQEQEEASGLFPAFAYDKSWSKDDSYLLAKIAMAEAEGCDTRTKELVILTILNRVQSSMFPDTIYDVIYQTTNGVPQFSPTASNRWQLEPNEDCWNAVENIAKAKYDLSQGCLYFESCKNEDNWHSRNLEFLFRSGGIRFYR